MASQRHRQALLNELTQIEAPVETSPIELINLIMAGKKKLAISFDSDDLPKIGPNHARALYISMATQRNVVPRILLDNGSALNILPLRTARILGIQKDEIPPSDLCVKGFDSSQREVVGNVSLTVRIGDVPFVIELCVIDINPSYNAILGRPWIHQAGVVASTFHQKVRFEHEKKIVTVDGEVYYTVTSNGTTHISHNDVELSGFHINAVDEDEGLGRNCNGILNPVLPADNTKRYGLGYIPTEADSKIKGAWEDCETPTSKVWRSSSVREAA